MEPLTRNRGSASYPIAPCRIRHRTLGKLAVPQQFVWTQVYVYHFRVSMTLSPRIMTMKRGMHFCIMLLLLMEVFGEFVGAFIKSFSNARDHFVILFWIHLLWLKSRVQWVLVLTLVGSDRGIKGSLLYPYFRCQKMNLTNIVLWNCLTNAHILNLSWISHACEWSHCIEQWILFNL
jgi:hypothetical protein